MDSSIDKQENFWDWETLWAEKLENLENLSEGDFDSMASHYHLEELNFFEKIVRQKYKKSKKEVEEKQERVIKQLENQIQKPELQGNPKGYTFVLVCLRRMIRITNVPKMRKKILVLLNQLWEKNDDIYIKEQVIHSSLYFKAPPPKVPIDKSPDNEDNNRYMDYIHWIIRNKEQYIRIQLEYMNTGKTGKADILKWRKLVLTHLDDLKNTKSSEIQPDSLKILSYLNLNFLGDAEALKRIREENLDRENADINTTDYVLSRVKERLEQRYERLTTYSRIESKDINPLDKVFIPFLILFKEQIIPKILDRWIKKIGNHEMDISWLRCYLPIRGKDEWRKLADNIKEEFEGTNKWNELPKIDKDNETEEKKLARIAGYLLKKQIGIFFYIFVPEKYALRPYIFEPKIALQIKWLKLPWNIKEEATFTFQNQSLPLGKGITPSLVESDKKDGLIIKDFFSDERLLHKKEDLLQGHRSVIIEPLRFSYSLEKKEDRQVIGAVLVTSHLRDVFSQEDEGDIRKFVQTFTAPLHMANEQIGIFETKKDKQKNLIINRTDGKNKRRPTPEDPRSRRKEYIHRFCREIGGQKVLGADACMIWYADAEELVKHNDSERPLNLIMGVPWIRRAHVNEVFKNQVSPSITPETRYEDFEKVNKLSDNWKYEDFKKVNKLSDNWKYEDFKKVNKLSDNWKKVIEIAKKKKSPYEPIQFELTDYFNTKYFKQLNSFLARRGKLNCYAFFMPMTKGENYFLILLHHGTLPKENDVIADLKKFINKLYSCIPKHELPGGEIQAFSILQEKLIAILGTRYEGETRDYQINEWIKIVKDKDENKLRPGILKRIAELYPFLRKKERNSIIDTLIAFIRFYSHHHIKKNLQGLFIFSLEDDCLLVPNMQTEKDQNDVYGEYLKKGIYNPNYSINFDILFNKFNISKYRQQTDFPFPLYQDKIIHNHGDGISIIILNGEEKDLIAAPFVAAYFGIPVKEIKEDLKDDNKYCYNEIKIDRDPIYNARLLIDLTNKNMNAQSAEPEIKMKNNCYYIEGKNIDSVFNKYYQNLYLPRKSFNLGDKAKIAGRDRRILLKVEIKKEEGHSVDICINILAKGAGNPPPKIWPEFGGILKNLREKIKQEIEKTKEFEIDEGIKGWFEKSKNKVAKDLKLEKSSMTYSLWQSCQSLKVHICSLDTLGILYKFRNDDLKKLSEQLNITLPYSIIESPAKTWEICKKQLESKMKDENYSNRDELIFDNQIVMKYAEKTDIPILIEKDCLTIIKCLANQKDEQKSLKTMDYFLTLNNLKKCTIIPLLLKHPDHSYQIVGFMQLFSGQENLNLKRYKKASERNYVLEQFKSRLHEFYNWLENEMRQEREKSVKEASVTEDLLAQWSHVMGTKIAGEGGAISSALRGIEVKSLVVLKM